MEAQAGTRPVSGQNQFDAGALQAYLRQAGTAIEGPITVEQFKGGQSNPTYKLVTPGASYVMRAKPGPQAKLLQSAHAIEREFRVMKALERTDVPVPKMVALCEDESVIGRAFYIMEYLEGRVLWDQTVPSLDNAGRAALYDELNRVIAALHNVDVNAVGLADYGRPGNYFQRQISRWSKQYVASITEPIPEMDKLIEWLPAHLPATALEDTTSIVHGDYRLDNVMFHPSEPRILAVLDWELSTTGHPLADFSYHCMSWHIPPGQFRGLGGIDIASLGIPSERDYVQKYCERTGRGSADALMADWNFYLAYNLFRLAAILQGIAKRSQDGTASSEQAKTTGAGARPLAELGWKFAQQGRRV